MIKQIKIEIKSILLLKEYANGKRKSIQFYLKLGNQFCVLDGNGMCQADIDYDPRFDEQGEVINIYNITVETLYI